MAKQLVALLLLSLAGLAAADERPQPRIDNPLIDYGAFQNGVENNRRCEL